MSVARITRTRKTVKYCECGCGQPTQLADRTWAKYGMRKGQPLRFVKGHNARQFGPKLPKNPPGQSNLRHGVARKGTDSYPFWCAWSQMRQRCLNPNQTSYKYYGGRGIRICERWDVFENFMEDMLPTWQKGLSLDRKDSDKDYGPDNCRWATSTTQIRNRRNTKMVEIFDERVPLSTAVELYAVVGYDTVCSRLRKGWGIEEALRTPLKLNYSRRK